MHQQYDEKFRYYPAKKDDVNQSLFPDSDQQIRITPQFFLTHFMQFIAMYISAGRPSKDTINTYEYKINQFLAWCKQVRVDPFKMSEQQMFYYRHVLIDERKYSEATVGVTFASVKAFYHAALKLNLVKFNPCDDIKVSSPHIEDRMYNYYTPDDLRKICYYTRDNFYGYERARNLVCLYLMACEGLRAVEVCRINREDIDWNNMTIFIHGKKHDGTIFPSEATFNVLRYYLDVLKAMDFKVQMEGNTTPLIVTCSTNSQGKRIARETLRWNINKVLKGVGMKKKGATCHVFRHSCGTALYDATKDLRTVQEVLRQRTPAVTARYAHVSERLRSRVTSDLGRVISNQNP